MTAKAPYKVLFLCTGNSARSIMAEHFLRHLGHSRFESYSAGSHPTGVVNPHAIAVLQQHHIDTSKARSKSWDEYRESRFDFVITVCDRARETCPVWPGQPVLAHWGSPDPAAVTGDERTRQKAFLDVASQIIARVTLLCAFRDEQLGANDVRQIGEQYSSPGNPSGAST